MTIPVGGDTSAYYTIPYPANQTAVGQGIFQVELKNVLGKPTEVWVRSTGTSGSHSKRVVAYMVVKNLNTWNNVIFGGTGQGGNAIGGNVDIRGSVHILGTSLGPSDFAMDLSGGANIGNNYTGMPVEISSRIPAIPTVNFGGEVVQSLSAEVRFKNGKLGLSGTALAGSPNVTGNAVKETMDGMFITHGYGGTAGTDNVNSDNGTGNSYDAGNALRFPIFSDPYVDRRDDSQYPTYNNFVTTKGLNVGAGLTIDPKPPGTPSFGPLADGNGNLIQWDNTTKTLTVAGVIYATGDIDLGDKNNNMYFQGRGTLVALGASNDLAIHGNFLTPAGRTFPTQDVIGLVAEDSVRITTGGGETQKRVLGAFYGQNEIRANFQAYMAGTFNSNHFEMNNVPSIYQVPSLVDNLPPGLIGDANIFVIAVRSWQEN